MTNHDRDSLITISRQREKLAKLDRDTLASVQKADFENQLNTVYPGRRTASGGKQNRNLTTPIGKFMRP
jgi:hypothetical protein